LVTFYNSFHTLRMDLGMLTEYVGLEHFREILTTDDVFWKAARNSLVWGVVAPLIDIPLALALALALYARVPFARVFRTVWFTPVLMSYPVVGVIWLWVYNYDWGLAILDFIGKMKQFALVWVMTRGGPMWGTETVATYVVKRAFEWKTLDLGYPSAIAVIWFVIIFGLTLLLTRTLQRRQSLEF